jgi:Uma2 family endonuclease
MVMSPPPAPSHGSFQLKIGQLLRNLVRGGRVPTECPTSTADGVKAADGAWASPERMRELGKQVCFPRAPEIWVEVMSPGNTEAEIEEEMALCFDAGAREVWLCAPSGAMSFFSFFSSGSARPMRASKVFTSSRSKLSCPERYRDLHGDGPSPRPI